MLTSEPLTAEYKERGMGLAVQSKCVKGVENGLVKRSLRGFQEDDLHSNKRRSVWYSSEDFIPCISHHLMTIHTSSELGASGSLIGA